jgi:hypothetical protein
MWVAAAALAMTALAACGANIDVRTVAAPEAAMLGGRQTFRVVEAGSDSTRYLNGNGNGDAYGMEDPMIHNSITSKLVHDEIKAAFEALGYRYSPDRADFDVSFKATIAPIMDIRSYGYGGYGYHWSGYYGYRGYPYAYDSWGCCGDAHAVASYDRRTVIIDAVDPSGKLLWRGQGTSDWYTDPKYFMKDLRHAVKALAKKFPRSNGTAAMIAER